MLSHKFLYKFFFRPLSVIYPCNCKPLKYFHIPMHPTSIWYIYFSNYQHFSISPPHVWTKHKPLFLSLAQGLLLSSIILLIIWILIIVQNKCIYKIPFQSSFIWYKQNRHCILSVYNNFVPHLKHLHANTQLLSLQYVMHETTQNEQFWSKTENDIGYL